MRRTHTVVLVVGLWLVAGSAAFAQCQGGGGGGSAARGAQGGTAAAAAGGQLLTGPGSWAYDVLLTQSIQQQVARQQYQVAQQRQAEKQQQLAQRRYVAEQKRQATADRRLRIREFIAQQNSAATPAPPAAYQTAYSTTR